MRIYNLNVDFFDASCEPTLKKYRNLAEFTWNGVIEPVGFSYGDIYFLVDHDGNQLIDGESLSKETIKEIICRWIDNAELIG